MSPHVARHLRPRFLRHAQIEQTPPAGGEITVARHREDLETTLGLLRVAVELEQEFSPGGAAGGPRLGREVFDAHFGELVEPLERWNGAVERDRTAAGSLWRWLEESAIACGIAEPPFAVGSLVDRVAILTVQRARRWESTVPYELRFERFAERGVAGIATSVYMDGQRIAEVPGGPVAHVERRVDGICVLVQAWFDSAQESACAGEISAARDALLELKDELRACVARRGTGPIASADGCRTCREGAAAAAPSPAE